MNLFKLSWSYLRRRPLNTLLNILLLSLGIATIVVLLLFSHQAEDNLYKNAEGIDVVVGAKGSPIQLILSGIYHIDAPTGNISLHEAKELMEHRMVRNSIPLALGDNFKGYRIVGTTTDYVHNYRAGLMSGTLWDHEFEVVLGSDVAARENLNLGDKIISSHGLSGAGHTHDDSDLIVVGILEKSNTVLDRLILTGVETMWGIHEDEEDHHEEDHHHDDGHHHEHQEEDAGHSGHDHSRGRSITDQSYLGEQYHEKEITSLLISYANPLAAAQFPRFVNSETSMQAAAPAFEITRLMSLLGIGLEAIEFFAIVLIFASMLGIFIALINSMKERKYDLAIMRTLGGSRFKLFVHVILEGIIIALAGAILGLILGHAGVEFIGSLMAEAQQFEITGRVFLPEEWWVIFTAVAVGVVAALIPAIQAYRTDISQTLSTS